MLTLIAPSRCLLAQCTVTPSASWKNTIEFPNDPFRFTGSSAGSPGWVKFTILLCDPDTVYYQDAGEYTFHYEFGVGRLDPLAGLSPEDFGQVTLYEAGQQAILGAVILPPAAAWPPVPAAEYGIQFLRRDAYDPQTIVNLFEQVRATIVADPGVQAYYFPAYEQMETAEQNRDFFESQGILISSPHRWASGNACYSNGWALGELKYVPGNEIAGAYLSGILGPDDILLTDGVPSEVPFVAGIVTLSPSTPNSHVAILASSYGVPFVHLALQDDAARAQQLVGGKIALRAYDTYGVCHTRLIDVDDVLSAEQIAEVLVLKDLPVLNISPMAVYGAYDAPTDGLVLLDVQYFGGKAANFGFLRREIPSYSPVSLAISFDLWNEFLDQILSGGSTLREEIGVRLSPFTYPPANMAALSFALHGVRNLFTDPSITVFTPAQQGAIIAILQDPQYGFDVNKKIRFRSSTNVEDSEHFSGAGLYDSYSGCLADDLDGDDAGPSICDAAEATERGVFRAIRKVFASFYNDNALLERLRYGINEAEVGMALLVHHSFPDEIELANGVATLERRYGTEITLVTQVGAISVSNPEDGSIPEEVSVYVSSSGWVWATLVQGSNLVQLGDTVLEWMDEYEALSQLLLSVRDGFEAATGKTTYLLDFEYKKVAPGGGALPAGGLVVKQVREIPQPDTTRSIKPFLINEPTEYCLFQGQGKPTEVFANHRLKSRWVLETESYWLTEENVAGGLLTTAEFEYTDGCSVRTVSGPIGEWPEASFWVEENAAMTGWAFPDLWNSRVYELEVRDAVQLVAPSESPLLTLRDFGWNYFEDNVDFGCLNVRVEHDEPVPSWNWQGPKTTTTDEVLLCRCLEEGPSDTRQQREFEVPGGALITTLFDWGPLQNSPGGAAAPLARWVETVISGLTSEPILLHDYYAQTYLTGQHNFTEDFIFDPFLDPDVPQHLLSELQSQDIRLIHASHSFGDPVVTLYPGEGVCGWNIPAISEWGLISMTLLFLAAGTVVLRRRVPLHLRTRAGR